MWSPTVKWLYLWYFEPILPWLSNLRPLCSHSTNKGGSTESDMMHFRCTELEDLTNRSWSPRIFTWGTENTKRKYCNVFAKICQLFRKSTCIQFWGHVDGLAGSPLFKGSFRGIAINFRAYQQVLPLGDSFKILGIFRHCSFRAVEIFANPNCIQGPFFTQIEFHSNFVYLWRWGGQNGWVLDPCWFDIRICRRPWPWQICN